MLVNGTFFTRLLTSENEEFEVSEEEMAKSFAKCLKEIRAYKNLTLKQVEAGTGIPFQTIARYENGENIPSVIQAFKFSYFYNLDINDMFLAGYVSDDGRERLFDSYFKK